MSAQTSAPTIVPPSGSESQAVLSAVQLARSAEKPGAAVSGAHEAERCGAGGEVPGTITIWLRAKLAAAEKALRAREQMEQSWKHGTDAEWEAAAKMHPDTANEPRMTKKDRLKEAATQARIAIRCHHDVEMFNAVLALLALMGGGGAEHKRDDSEPAAVGRAGKFGVGGSAERLSSWTRRH